MTSEEERDLSQALQDERRPGGVFISHVHEDQALADAFALLLRDATAGSLEVYSSSDKTPGEGIRYGTEWFQWIKQSVLAADHVVAVLTPKSLERPWILFEAGLGKAKPDGSVLGLAVGVSVAEASAGPFGVFQNSGSDEKSIHKLCRQLLEGSGARPRDEVLTSMIGSFLEEVSTYSEPANDTQADDSASDGTAAIFQSIEDLKFLVQRRSIPDAETLPRRRHVRSMLDLLERVGHDLPATSRIPLLAALGEEIGLASIAALVRELGARRSPARSPEAFMFLFHESLDAVRPWSRESEQFLWMVRREFEMWSDRARVIEQRRASALPLDSDSEPESSEAG